jgi:hypothetical protein
MPISLTVSAQTATTATFGFTGIGASGTIELQISPDPDFAFCVCPTYTGLPRSSPYVLPALNQRCTYWARARTRLASGVAEPWSNVVKFRTDDGTAQSYPAGGILIEPALIVLPEPIVPYEIGTPHRPDFPVSNLIVDAPSACRMDGFLSSDVFVHNIAFTVGRNVEIDTIALLNTNLPEDTVIWGFRSEDQAFGSQTVVFGLQPFRASPNLPGRRGYHALLRFAPARNTHWYVQMISTQPLLHAEHLVVGLARSSKNVSVDKKESPAALGTIERRRSGAPDRQNGYTMRRVEFDISAMSETQYETLYGDLRYWQNKPVLVVPNSRTNAFLHDRILYGDLSGGQSTMVNSPIYTRSFAIDSLI